MIRKTALILSLLTGCASSDLSPHFSECPKAKIYFSTNSRERSPHIHWAKTQFEVERDSVTLEGKVVPREWGILRLGYDKIRQDADGNFSWKVALKGQETEIRLRLVRSAAENEEEVLKIVVPKLER